MPHYDAIIIGSGQAGNPLAHNLADQGWQVALIEKEHLGGSCINYGCTPTKTLVASALAAHMARRGPEFGVHTGPVQVDMAQVMARKDRIVQQWRQGQEGHVAKRPNITLYRATARFTGPHTVEADGQELTGDHIFINTGTSPRIPAIPGIQEVPYLTNRTILALTELPEHLLVLGGGYIGLEFGQIFHRLGSQVTVVVRSDAILSREDRDVSDTLREALEAEGMRFVLSSTPSQVAQDDQGRIHLTVTSQEEPGSSQVLTGSHLLVATGRIPNSRELNLDAAGIQADQRGWIQVNEYLETNVPGVYALGDVKGGPAFTHISYNDFQIAYHNLFHSDRRSIRGRLVPYTLFTDPELGRVGMTEKAARAAGHNVKVGSIPMGWVARAIESNQTQGMMKVVVDGDTERILGAAILGPSGGELVQTLMVAMMADAPWTLLKGAVYIHPTLTEGFFTLMDSVQ